MKYTFRIDLEKAPNVFDTMLVCVTEDLSKFEDCYKAVITGLMYAQTLQRTSWKYEEGFTHLIVEIKL